MKSDNQPELASLIASCTLRAMKSGSRMIIQNSPVGRSKGNGVIERAIRSAKGMIWTACSEFEERWRVKIHVTHPIWPWITVHAGFLLTRFEVGRDGKTAYEWLKGKSPKVQGIALAERILWKRKRAGELAREVAVHVGGQHQHGCHSNHGGRSSCRIGVACGSRGLFERSQRDSDEIETTW